MSLNGTADHAASTSTQHTFLLGVVVVATRQQVAKNKLRHVDPMLTVNSDRNTLACTPPGEGSALPFVHYLNVHVPSFMTLIVPASASISTRILLMVASFCLLSAALTKISSKILYRPGTCDHHCVSIPRIGRNAWHAYISY